MSGALPRSVLFACTRNAIRSPMAAALMRARFGPDMHVESAGLIAGEPDPFADAVMREIGIAAETSPQSVETMVGAGFDLIVVLSEEAFARVQALADGAGIACELWRIPDPSISEGSREQRLAGYRQVRDLLRDRIEARFAARDA